MPGKRKEQLDFKEAVKDKRGFYYFKRWKGLPLIAAFSDGSLNLGFGNNNPSSLTRNRSSFLKPLGIKFEDLVCARQPHRQKAIEVDLSSRGKGALRYKEAIPSADALVTRTKNLALAIFIADCFPIFVYDQENEVVGLAHVGWKGTRLGITKNMLELMKGRFQTYPQNILVGIGPGIRSCCYEVGKEFTAYFSSRLIRRNNRFYLDLIQLNKEQLLSLGVKKENIIDSRLCTSCLNTEFFSYRKEGASCGRMMAVVMLKG